ncbi:Plasma membrane sulfite pump involved in sulfite metabolism [Ceratobasidium sp. 395]|nr:Plasma membrane sulfite pump involved in sulfite metabolism [Ceratobasidium sp. 395]
METRANGDPDMTIRGDTTIQSVLFRDVDCVKNFMPSWFAVNMGTGAVSTLLWNFPYGPKPMLHLLGTGFLVLNIILFVTFCALSLIRYFRYPQLIHLTYRHPIQSLYLGCLPMGFATIINATLNLNQGYGLGGESLLYILWSLWWLDSIASLAIYFLMLYSMITRQNHNIKALTAVWLLPAVTPIVPSTTGALLARAILPHSTNHAILTLFSSTILLFLGLSLTFMILPLYVFRLITEGLPEKTLIISKFFPVGPCGQGGAAFVIIGQTFAEIARRRLSDHGLLSESQPWNLLGVSCGSFLWTFGIWWIVSSIFGMYETFRWDPPNFAVGFWGMVFPLGVYAFLTLQLSQALGSTILTRLAATFSMAVFILWGTLAVATTHQLLRNRKQLFSAPFGLETPRNSPPESPRQPWLLDRSDGRIRI